MTEVYEAMIDKEGMTVRIEIVSMLSQNTKPEFTLSIEIDTVQELSQRLSEFSERRKTNLNTSTESVTLIGLARLKNGESFFTCRLRIENLNLNYIKIDLIGIESGVTNFGMTMHMVEAAKLGARLQRIRQGEAKQEIVEGIYIRTNLG